MIWASIKAKLYLGIGLLVVALLAALRIQSARVEKYKKNAEVLKGRVDHATNVIKAKDEHETEFFSHTAKLAKDIEDRGTSEELGNPNDDW